MSNVNHDKVQGYSHYDHDKKVNNKSISDSVAIYATGRRKNAVARVWIKPGSGKIFICKNNNKKTLLEYFKRLSLANQIQKVFLLTSTSGYYDVTATVKGGGLSGQAGAVLHGISRSLSKISPEIHDVLHKAGLLTRDSRIVERKKYGRHKARKKTQFSKR